MTHQSDHDHWFEAEVAPRLREEFETELARSQDNQDRVRSISNAVLKRVEEIEVERSRGIVQPQRSATPRTSRWRRVRLIGGLLSTSAAIVFLISLSLQTSLRPIAWQPPASLQRQVLTLPANHEVKPSPENATAENTASPNVLLDNSAEDAEQGLQLLEASITSAFSLYESPLSNWAPLEQIVAQHRGETRTDRKPQNADVAEHPIAHLASNLLGRSASFE